MRSIRLAHSLKCAAICISSTLILCAQGFAADATAPGRAHEQSRLVLDETVDPSTAAIENDGPVYCPASSVWLMSTRGIPGNCPRCGATPNVWQYECGAGWIPSSLDEFLATDDPNTVTVVFIHGNRITAQEASNDGLSTYRRIGLAGPCGPGVRYVIWSWPSDPLHGTLTRDAEIKAARTDAEAYYVASFLGRIRGDVSINLIGFSFGARITGGALHLRGGGSVLGHALEAPATPRVAAARATLIAAAMDCDWLMPGRRYGLAVGQVEHMLVTVNCDDIILRHYPRITDRGVEAIGLTGVAGAGALGADRAKIDQRTVTNIVGHRHGWSNYLESPSIMSLVRREIVMQSMSTASHNVSLAP